MRGIYSTLFGTNLQFAICWIPLAGHSISSPPCVFSDLVLLAVHPCNMLYKYSDGAQNPRSRCLIDSYVSSRQARVDMAQVQAALLASENVHGLITRTSSPKWSSVQSPGEKWAVGCTQGSVIARSVRCRPLGKDCCETRGSTSVLISASSNWHAFSFFVHDHWSQSDQVIMSVNNGVSFSAKINEQKCDSDPLLVSRTPWVITICGARCWSYYHILNFCRPGKGRNASLLWLSLLCQRWGKEVSDSRMAESFRGRSATLETGILADYDEPKQNFGASFQTSSTER
jgi:hypothetical protein